MYIHLMAARRPTPLPFSVQQADIGGLARSHGPWLAVVSSDNSYLSHGGGSSLSIWDAAGLPAALPAALAVPRPLASVTGSRAGALQSSLILHAVTLEIDSRERLDLTQCELLFHNLEHEIRRALVTNTRAPRKILMPLVGCGVAGVSESVVAEHIAALAGRLHPEGVQFTIAVLNDSLRITETLRSAFGVIELPVDLPEWLGTLPTDPLQLLRFYLDAIGSVLNLFQPTSTDHDGRTLPLSPLWKHARQILHASKATDLPWPALHLLPEVIALRNQLVHSGSVAKPTVIAANLAESALKGLIISIAGGGVRGVDIQMLRNALQANAGRDERIEHVRYSRPPEMILVRPRRREISPSEPPEIQVGTPSTPPSLTPSSHVRKLAEVLMELPEADRTDLLEKLTEMGYRGEDEKRLIEYCTRGDPTEILDELGIRLIRSILKRRYSIEIKPTEPLQKVRNRLLHELGFRIPADVHGLDSARTEMRTRRTELLAANRDEIRGHVITGSAQLERCIRDLLRFICIHLFDTGPEQHFKGQLSGAATDNISRAPLGTLLGCLEKLAKEIEAHAKSEHADDASPLRELQGPLSAKRLAPQGITGITRLRNAFAHIERDQMDHEHRACAAEFFKCAIELLDHWKAPEHRVYPTIIRIEEIRFDRWNRRTIIARTDDGSEETIVCDDVVTPGDIYFMYPITNPMRVDPILIRFQPDE